MNKALILLLTISLSAATLTPPAAQAGAQTAPPGIRRSERPVPNSYIVVLKDEVAADEIAAAAAKLSHAHGGLLTNVYRRALRGFSVRMPEKAAQALARNPQVAYVEEDGLVETAATQTNAPWGLDRIDQRDLPLDSTYTYANSGAGVRAYVIDSGIRTTHEEFEGRASVAFDNVGDGGNGQDCFGHGTHVASVIGGKTFGVAKSVQLHAVRVFGCTGTSPLTQVLAGVDWVTANHVKPAVALFSFSRAGSTALDTSVFNLIDAGVTVVVAAGNNNLDASLRSPARVEEALTVGATNVLDIRANFSNFGWVLDLFAPGVDVDGASIFSDTATRTDSGTSYAAAHVAGVAARYLSGNPLAPPWEVYDGVVGNATPDKITDPGADSPNLLLFQPKGKIGFESSRDRGNGEIYMMNADGSSPTRLTYNLARDQTPAVSPDGTKIVFASDRDRNPNPGTIWDMSTFEIYVMNVDGSNVQRLTNNTTSDIDPTWSPDGTQIAFATNRDGDFEIFKMNANGTSQTRVTNNTGWDADPDWSPGGTKIAFESDRGNQMYDVFTINPDGTGETQLTDSSNLWDRWCEQDCTDGASPSWSSDSSQIAFEGNGQIWVMNADGSSKTQVTSLSGGAYEPAWSGDGTKIAFGKPGGSTQSEIAVMNPNGTGITTLTSAPGEDTTPGWSADDSKIAFVSGRDDLGDEVYTMTSGGGDQNHLTNHYGNDYDASWSPDGTRIAFVSLRDGNREIYVMDGGGGNQVRLTNTTADESDPVWSPDGAKIAFTRYSGTYEVYVMNADGTGVTNLTNNTAYDYQPTWSPDGTKIAFSTTRNGSNEIYVMNADGSGQTRVTNNTVYDYEPAWSPDGTKIAFASYRSGNYDIYTISPNGTGEVRITTHASEDRWPAWSPDGTRIVFCSLRDGQFEIYVMNADGTGQTRLTYSLGFDTRPAWQPL